jgi:hypothetical protein
MSSYEAPNKAAGNNCIPFPWKLHEMLSCAKTEDFESVVSWLPDGNSFKVHDQDEFVSNILPAYLENQTKYKSFQRQLNLWGFERILHGDWKGGYYHKDFVKGQESHCQRLTRQKVKRKSRAARALLSPSSSTESLTELNKSAQVKSVVPREVFEDHKDDIIKDLMFSFDNLVDSPQNGDPLLFEGRQFFFVQEYNQREGPRKQTPASSTSKDLSSFSFDHTLQESRALLRKLLEPVRSDDTLKFDGLDVGSAIKSAMSA